MRNIWNIAINDLRVYLKEPGTLINLFVMPIVFAVVLGFGMGGGSPTTQPSAFGGRSPSTSSLRGGSC